jgi:uncharacterized protein (TIGR03435 family)
MRRSRLRMLRSLVAWTVVLTMLSPATRVHSQEPAAAFDVASVKVNRSGAVLGSITFQRGGGFTATNVALRELIRAAYGLQNAQLAGGPEWIESTRFDVIAKAPGTARSSPAMLRALLADRFRLRVHTEMLELPLYALVMARTDRRLGPQLRVSKADCDVFIAAREAGAPPAAPGTRQPCDEFNGVPPRMEADGVTMGQLAGSLSRNIRETVIDRTGLTGVYDFELQWTPDRLPPRPAGADPNEPVRLNSFVVDPNGPSIFTALREQLGLELERQKGPVEVVVIDSVSPPDPD